jgi:5'-methylthioadenosine phosphorylase
MEQILGIIGGSGLYGLDGLEEMEELAVETPYGAASDAVVRGRLGATTLLFLPRHGRGHRVPPHRINYRANMFALKQLGAHQVLSVSAVGSLKEYMPPGDFVIVDQFIDRTRGRASTFFDDFGIVAHVSFGDPVDAALSAALRQAAEAAGVRVHTGGTYVCMEGPQFSSRAESELYRSWGASVIGARKHKHKRRRSGNPAKPVCDAAEHPADQAGRDARQYDVRDGNRHDARAKQLEPQRVDVV